MKNSLFSLKIFQFIGYFFSRCSGEEDEIGDWCCQRQGSTKTCDSDLVTPSNITSDKLVSGQLYHCYFLLCFF